MTSKHPKTFREIIDTWPFDPAKQTRLQAFAADLGVRYGAAVLMRHRGRVAPVYWPRLVKKRTARGMTDVSNDVLARIEADRANKAKSRRPRRRLVTLAA